jgi:hypothetical protein
MPPISNNWRGVVLLINYLDFASNFEVFLLQLLFGLWVGGVDQDAIDWAHLLALRLVVVAYALRAQIRVDLVNFLALIDRGVRALGLAHVTINALVGNEQRHDYTSFLQPLTDGGDSGS